MSEVKIQDRIFAPYISTETLQKRVTELAASIFLDYVDKNPLFIAMLNGAFIFASDIFRQFPRPAQISFVMYSSYEGISNGSRVRQIMGLQENIKDRHIVLLEDIIDTGRTMAELLPQLIAQQPASLHIATLLLKPRALEEDIAPKYIGFSIPNDFVLGYGMDYNGYGRNLPAIYQLKA